MYNSTVHFKYIYELSHLAEELRTDFKVLGKDIVPHLFLLENSTEEDHPSHWYVKALRKHIQYSFKAGVDVVINNDTWELYIDLFIRLFEEDLAWMEYKGRSYFIQDIQKEGWFEGKALTHQSGTAYVTKSGETLLHIVELVG